MQDMLREQVKAINPDKIMVHYQPKMSMESGRCDAAEALARWHNPIITPDIFIPLMEENGVIRQLTTIMFSKVCQDIINLKRKHSFCPVISVNVAPSLLEKHDFVDDLILLVKRHEVSPSEIDIEITESGTLKNLDAVIDGAARLRAAGFTIALDDFGIGLSGLQNLSVIPATSIKIDRHFVISVGVQKNGDKLLMSMVNMGKTLGMKCVVEGVETEKQMKIVIDHGCDEIQGFLFSKPLPTADFSDFIAWHSFRPHPLLADTCLQHHNRHARGSVSLVS